MSEQQTTQTAPSETAKTPWLHNPWPVETPSGFPPWPADPLVPTYSFYESIQAERKAWDGKRAPPLPGTIGDYLHKKGPVCRGDTPWHTAFWQSVKPWRHDPEIAVGWLCALACSPGNCMRGFEGLLCAIPAEALAVGLSAQGGPGRALPAIVAELDRLGLEWTPPADPARRTWGANAFSKDEDVRDANRQFLNRICEKLSDVSSADTFSGYARLLLNLAANPLPGSPDGSFNPDVSGCVLWMRAIAKAGVDPAIGADFSEMESNAASCCKIGGKNLGELFFSMYGSVPDVFKTYNRLACRVFMEAAQTARVLYLESEILETPGLSAIAYNIFNPVQRPVQNCLRRIRKDPGFFLDIDSSRHEFLGSMMAVSANVNGALACSLAMIADGHDKGPSGSLVSQDDWTCLWRAHATNRPTPQRHVLMLSLCPDKWADNEHSRHAMESFTPKQISVVESLSMQSLCLMVLGDSSDSDETPVRKQPVSI